MDFAKELFEMPFSKRYNYLKKIVNEAIDTDSVSLPVQTDLIEAMNVLYGKIKR